VDGFDAARLEEFVEALKDTPGIQVAFNRVPYSLADRTFETNGTLAACKRLGVGVVASSPLGEGSRVTNTTHAECDQALVRLLAFLGAMVGGGVQRSPLQVSLNYVMSKGLVPEIETRMGSLAWECGGSMLWRLDENAIGILDERCEAVEKGETGDGGGPALA
jgi:aryl-alcohol dehydrogenase-like predicted oxidoreductase